MIHVLTEPERFEFTILSEYEMVPGTFPGWLLKRASEMRAHRIIGLISPDDPSAQCAYLLELDNDFLELHIAEDGHAGVEAATLTLSRKQLAEFAGQLLGAMTGRRIWTTVPKQADSLSSSS